MRSRKAGFPFATRARKREPFLQRYVSRMTRTENFLSQFFFKVFLETTFLHVLWYPVQKVHSQTPSSSFTDWTRNSCLFLHAATSSPTATSSTASTSTSAAAPSPTTTSTAPPPYTSPRADNTPSTSTAPPPYTANPPANPATSAPTVPPQPAPQRAPPTLQRRGTRTRTLLPLQLYTDIYFSVVDTMHQTSCGLYEALDTVSINTRPIAEALLVDPTRFKETLRNRGSTLNLKRAKMEAAAVLNTASGQQKLRTLHLDGVTLVPLEKY